METNTAILSLKRYDELRDKERTLGIVLIELNQLRSEKENLKNAILKENLDDFNIANYPLEDLCDLNSHTSGLCNIKKLRLLGISDEDMKIFITEEKEYFEQQKVQIDG